jgi:hypothetical protein
MKALKFSLAALLLATCVLVARQQFTPLTPTSTVPGSTGSLMTETLVLQSPSVNVACGTYNQMYFNGLTGDEFGCVAGLLQAVPVRLSTGTSANTDMAGFITLASGVGTLTFTGTYATAPVCTATDSTAANAVKASASTTVLSVAGTTTDVIAYTCIKRT